MMNFSSGIIKTIKSIHDTSIPDTSTVIHEVIDQIVTMLEIQE